MTKPDPTKQISVYQDGYVRRVKETTSVSSDGMSARRETNSGYTQHTDRMLYAAMASKRQRNL